MAHRSGQIATISALRVPRHEELPAARHPDRTRRCSECGSPLNSYNLGLTCYLHQKPKPLLYIPANGFPKVGRKKKAS